MIRLPLFVSTEKLLSRNFFKTRFVEFHLPRFELCLSDKMEESSSALGQEELGISTSNTNYNANQTNKDTLFSSRNKREFKIKCIIPLHLLWVVVDDVAQRRKNEICTCKTLYLHCPNGHFWATFR